MIDTNNVVDPNWMEDKSSLHMKNIITLSLLYDHKSIIAIIVIMADGFSCHTRKCLDFSRGGFDVEIIESMYGMDAAKEYCKNALIKIGYTFPNEKQLILL